MESLLCRHKARACPKMVADVTSALVEGLGMCEANVTAYHSSFQLYDGSDTGCSCDCEEMFWSFVGLVGDVFVVGGVGVVGDADDCGGGDSGGCNRRRRR